MNQFEKAIKPSKELLTEISKNECCGKPLKVTKTCEEEDSFCLIYTCSTCNYYLQSLEMKELDGKKHPYLKAEVRKNYKITMNKKRYENWWINSYRIKKEVENIKEEKLELTSENFQLLKAIIGKVRQITTETWGEKTSLSENVEAIFQKKMRKRELEQQNKASHEKTNW
ncbi:hypothetical protein [endosymbiont GvMRE of Glomus versiforme]|uniref:hypothetical protein n=1 Tax=endosymbiont GvMRE of Glomus versiforme TaxID=2039283 RepID=UPI000EBF8CCE|nr:hypothetical protein [endosymbiont GvMRE of Glomus versiforme]RHZ36654.1 hypothetical protein GvMRE_I2g97 [endosymbiont GvMRE of Glomus versiforme]